MRYLPVMDPRLSIVVLITTLVFGTASLFAQEHSQEDSSQKHHGAMHHRFVDAERWSKRFDDPERDSWQKPAVVITKMEITPGMTVADIGAGTGYFVAYLSSAVGPHGSVLGLDIEPSMVEFMTKRAKKEGLQNVEARVVDPNDPGIGTGKVDRVLIVNTWHHIAKRAAYAEILLRGLTPEGRVYIVDFTRDSPHGPPVSQRLSPERVMEELEAGGLEAKLVEETLPDQYIVVGSRRR